MLSLATALLLFDPFDKVREHAGRFEVENIVQQFLVLFENPGGIRLVAFGKVRSIVAHLMTDAPSTRSH